MVDWTSPTELANEAIIFKNLMHALIGLYAWEFLTSLDFEWDLLTGRKRFRWPLIFYFAGRYTLLGALIGVGVALDVTTPLNCQALYTYSQFMGDAAVGFASINLALRVIAIYKSDKIVMGVLVLAILGHWACIFAGVSLTAVYVPGQGCAITHTNSRLISVVFLYSMCFDFFVLALSAAKLAFPIQGRSQLVRLLFQDGLIYFIIAFVANLTATTFMFLNLNPIMSIIFNVPSAIASTIVASRTVRRLTNFVTVGPEMLHVSGSQGLPAATRSRSGTGPLSPRGMTDGVHVRMETFSAVASDNVSPIKTREYILDDDLESGPEPKY